MTGSHLILELHRGHERGRGDLKSTGDANDIHQTGIPLAALDPSNVGPMKLNSNCKSFLAHPSTYSQLANGQSEAALRLHAEMVDAR